MDIRRIRTGPTTEERAAVDALLGAPRSTWEGGLRGSARDTHAATVGGRETRAMRHLLLPALQALQACAGWISDGGLGYVCDRLNVPPADAWGVATFYALLATTRRPRRVVHVCDDIACKCRGADEMIVAVERIAGAPLSSAAAAAPSAARTVEVGNRPSAWQRSPCLGLCDQGPAALVTVAGAHPREFAVGHLTPGRVLDLLAGDDADHGRPSRPPVPPALARGGGRLLRNVGVVDPTSLDAYRAAGGFAALEKARAIGATGVVSEITASGLVGRGGAGFPTSRKWEAVRTAAATPHYLVCNADESEPGTFKDRVLLEEDPFAIVEAIAIAAFAVGCETAFIYIRGEYALAAARMKNAIALVRAAGLVGALDIEIRRGGGAYVCGEETALFESIEGYRGEPRNKPPFPAEAGLFGMPTVVNNVETLANVPHIVLHGGTAFAAEGTPQSTGTRLFCVSGNVQRPGVYEMPCGASLRTLVDAAGGAVNGHAIRAVLLGGAAGTFVRPDELDLRLTHEDTRAAGTTLGSGAVMVIDDSVDLRSIVLRIATFFRDESCGQCVPCRVGTIRLEEALHRIATSTVANEISLLDEIGAAMKDASICGLGQTAYSAIESAIKRLHLYDEATR
jgi:NADH-quinone oxidoreductase subunit F